MVNSTEILDLCNKLQPLVMEFASQKDPSEREPRLLVEYRQ